MTIELSLLLTGVSVAFAIFFGITSKSRNDRKDTEEHTQHSTANTTMVMVKLENIADDLKDIKRESKENREEMQHLRERVVVVEQSLKSYHKRLDRLDEKTEEND
jgi:peptidoglycan hydrolase CwlO-like protein